MPPFADPARNLQQTELLQQMQEQPELLQQMQEPEQTQPEPPFPGQSGNPAAKQSKWRTRNRKQAWKKRPQEMKDKQDQR